MTRQADQVLDEYLVVLSQGGSAAAFTQLVERWSGRITGFARRRLGDADLAADVVQDTWLSVVRNLRRLDDPSKFPGWLYAIAARKCADAGRSRGRTTRLRAKADGEVVVSAQGWPPGASPDAALDLAAALGRLPPHLHLTVELIYGAGLSVAEVARAARLPEGTIKSRLHAARQLMKSHLEET